MPRRSAHYKRKSRKKRIKRYLSIGSLFVFFLLFLSFYTFYKQFHQSYISAESLTSSEDFTKKDFYTIALISSKESFENTPLILDTTKVLLFSTKRGEYSVYEVPGDLEVDMPGRFGVERVDRSFALGILEANYSSDSCGEECSNAGLNFTVSNLENLIGGKVDRFVLVEPSMKEYSEEILIGSNLRKFFSRAEIRNIKSSLKTNMSFADFLHFYSLTRSYSKEDISFNSLSEVDRFDAYVRELTYDSKLAEEKKSVAVLNGARIPGLASFGSRVVKNRGGYVVSVDNTSSVYEDTYIITNDKESYTVKYLADMFEVDGIFNKKELPEVGAEAVIDRVDITLILGVDNSSKY